MGLTCRGAQARVKDPRHAQAREGHGGGTGGVRQLMRSFRFFCQILKGAYRSRLVSRLASITIAAAVRCRP